MGGRVGAHGCMCACGNFLPYICVCHSIIAVDVRHRWAEGMAEFRLMLDELDREADFK